MTSVSCASWIERFTKIDPSKADVDADAGRQRRRDARQRLAHRVGHLDQVGLGLPHHAEADRRARP